MVSILTQFIELLEVIYKLNITIIRGLYASFRLILQIPLTIIDIAKEFLFLIKPTGEVVSVIKDVFYKYFWYLLIPVGAIGLNYFINII